MIKLTEMIAEQLAIIFPEITIYSENQASGFDVPSFYISRVGNNPVTPRMFNVQERTYGYQIVYFPNPKRPNQDMEEKQDKLSDSFLTLADQATVRNREFSIDTNEQTLTFSFDVTLRMMKQSNGTLKGDVSFNGGIKN